MHFHISLKERYLGLKATAQHQNHPVLIRAEGSRAHTILWKFPQQVTCSHCPSCSNESNQSYIFCLYGTITELYPVFHMEVQLLKQSPKIKGLYNERKWKSFIAHHFQPSLPVWNVLANAQVIIKVLFLILFIRLVILTRKEGKNDKQGHALHSSILLPEVVSACCGAQVLIRRLFLLLEKAAFDWSCLRSELMLHETEEYISAFCLVAICYPLTFATV